MSTGQIVALAVALPLGAWVYTNRAAISEYCRAYSWIQPWVPAPKSPVTEYILVCDLQVHQRYAWILVRNLRVWNWALYVPCSTPVCVTPIKVGTRAFLGYVRIRITEENLVIDERLDGVQEMTKEDRRRHRKWYRLHTIA